MSDPPPSPRNGKTEVLVRAAKKGQQAAWTEVFARYERMLLGHVRTLAARHKLAVEGKDVVQATFTRAWSQIESFEYTGEGSFRRWLYTIAKHLYLNELKAVAGRELRAETGVLENAADEKGAASDRARFENAALYAALAELDEEDREILLMHYHEGLNLNQIAEVLECCHETAERRRQAALTRMRAKLGARPGT